MRTTTAPELVLLHSPLRSEAAKIEIVRSGSPVDISKRLHKSGGSINFSADNRVATASVTFEDDHATYGQDSDLNPLVDASSYNSPTPLVWPNNELKIYLGVGDSGSDATANVKLAFHGVIGSNVGLSMSAGVRTVSIECTDQAKRLQDHYIVGEYVYGEDDGTAAVAVIQSILNDCFSWETTSSDYKKLHIDSSAYTNCSLMVYPRPIGNCTCWEAINKVIGCAAADDMGFELRYAYLPDGDTSTKDNEGNVITTSGEGFHLCLLQIDQSDTSADDSVDVDADELHEESIAIRDDTIRNSVYGRYIDRDTKEEMEIHRDSPASIAIYNRRDMVIGQVDVPMIDTYEEMWDLLGVALNALDDVPGTARFTTQLMYHVDPNDILGTTNAQMYTGSDKVGITEIAHSFAPGGGPSTRQGFTTTFTGVRDKRTGSRIGFLTATGDVDPGITLPPSVVDGEAHSFWGTDEKGNSNTKTTFTVPNPQNIQFSAVDWRYSVEGEGHWREETITGLELTVWGLPPGKPVSFLHRFVLKGGER